MSAMLFELKNGQMRPRMPIALDNSLRVADGVRYFTLAQAVEKSSRPEAELVEAWNDHAGDFMPLSDLSIDDDSPALPLQLMDARLRLLHQTIYPHLGDEEFNLFCEMMRERRLSVWTRHVWPEIQADGDGKRKLVFITTIDAFRVIAQRTGEYLPGETNYVDAEGEITRFWRGEDPPVAVLASVRRCGQECWADASWRSFAQMVPGPGGKEIPADPWRKMPDVMLSKCAEARALRKAFPEDLAGLYTREEMMQRSNRPAARQALPDGVPDASVTDETPESEFRFRLQVIDLVGSKRADNLIDHFRALLGHRYAGESQPFFATVLAELRRHPAKYGVELATAG